MRKRIDYSKINILNGEKTYRKFAKYPVSKEHMNILYTINKRNCTVAVHTYLSSR